jgi:hypothetical protein
MYRVNPFISIALAITALSLIEEILNLLYKLFQIGKKTNISKLLSINTVYTCITVAISRTTLHEVKKLFYNTYIYFSMTLLVILCAI